MNETETEIPEVDPEIPTNAVSVYGQRDALEDFPVLKAFQQYIDAEQAKSRKRLLVLCVFFGILMLGVIGVFVSLLFSASQRNQSLNDRLVEYAMKERERAAANASVVTPPQPDQSAIVEKLKLESKLETLQQKFSYEQAKSERIVKEIAEKTKQEIEQAHKETEQIKADLAKKAQEAEQARQEAERIKADLAKKEQEAALAQKAKQLAEDAIKNKERLAEAKKLQRKAELEEYYRKHYPELYAPKQMPQSKQNRSRLAQQVIDGINDETADEQHIDDDADEEHSDGAIDWFEGQEESAQPKMTKSNPPKKRPSPSTKKEFSIPVDIRGSRINWNIPE